MNAQETSGHPKDAPDIVGNLARVILDEGRRAGLVEHHVSGDLDDAKAIASAVLGVVLRDFASRMKNPSEPVLAVGRRAIGTPMIAPDAVWRDMLEASVKSYLQLAGERKPG